MLSRIYSIWYRSNPGSMLYIMRTIRLPPGNMSVIIKIRYAFALKDLGHQVGIGDRFDVCKYIGTTVGVLG